MVARGFRTVLAVVGALVCMGVLWAGLAGAAVGEFGSEGTGAGEFIEPHGLAVEQQSGDMYVVDRNNSRVEKFSPQGIFLLAWGWGVGDGETPVAQTCTSECFEAVAGAGAGQLDFPEGVAVDNDPLSLSHGDVYVADSRNDRVEKFDSAGNFLLAFGGGVNLTKDETPGATEAEKDLCTAASGDRCTAGSVGTADGQFEAAASVAIGSDGTVYVGDANRVQEFTPEGTYQSQTALPGSGFVYALAVTESGDLYVASRELAGVREYDGAGAEVGSPRDAQAAPFEISQIALGPLGELFVEDRTNGRHLLEYGATGDELASFDAAATSGGNGLAFGETAGALYVAGTESVHLALPPQPGPLAVSSSESASLVTPASGRLNAELNAEGNDTTYRFEYGTSTAYGTSLPVPDGKVPAGFEDVPVSVDALGLSARTLYHYRIVASNSAGTFTSPDQTFTTFPPATIEDVSSANVAATSATLEAQVDPWGDDTAYLFEYGTSTAYGASAPAGEGDVGSGESAVPVEAHVHGLEPATVYHYRLLTRNALGVVEGEDHTFTTEPAKARGVLPDGRSWELVSPVDKQGAALESITREGGVIQAAADGNAISYVSSAATELEPQGNRNLEFSQIFSSRGASGWSSKDIDTPNDEMGHLFVGAGGEYRMFSSDLSVALLAPRSETPLPPLAAGAEKTLYLRDGTDGAYTPLVTAQNVRPGAKFGPIPAVSPGLVFDAATPSLDHVVLSSPAALTPDAVEGDGQESLYEWSGGQLRLASVLPDEKPASEEKTSSALGEQGHLVRHAISDDGARIVWEGIKAEGAASEHYYLRDMARGETIQIDAAQGVKEVTNDPALFQTASSDDSRVFFTSTARLTGDPTTFKTSGPTKNDLYVFEVTSGGGEPLAGRLTDLTVDVNAGETASVHGVIGASEGGTVVYFVADGVLGDGAERGATPGTCESKITASSQETCNLYVERYQASSKTWSDPHFVAALSGEDRPSWNGAGFPQNLNTMAARVSPDGRWLAFMSERGLTGYDNRDAVSGNSDEEVFLYDEQSARLSCVSCDPTGAKPEGSLDLSEYPGLLADRAGVWPGQWLAALIPGWTAVDLSHSLYQSRYLSSDGRLFFDSPDALSPADTNGTWDVYEFEPEGVGGCTSESLGFEQSSAGCVALISSGGSGEESAFLDASESGNDVFFLTAAGLVDQDQDGLPDVYDARVCSGSSPCLAAPPVSPPACSTSDSCKPAPSPQPTSFGAPSSQTFSGTGNVALGVSKPAVKSKHLRSAGKLAGALRSCRKRPKHKRAACERQARRRYGTAARSGKSKAINGLPGRAGR